MRSVALRSPELFLGVPIDESDLRVRILHFILNRICCILLVAPDLLDNAKD